ncbi:PfkB family carbohydrate kinase [Microscilla marina]|uniref:Carbohydrate kinase, PfkB family n=1 Tax=Microscilla marina ATCC 23134 TaxID=313606 RepID=A1ZHY1_MICM2|nr:PfkB family carbohydrate kinase [Microscilla marina]EAY30138.1 carbohydrate kinase, PfkB family [Microscilla marina ATCC 23134]
MSLLVVGSVALDTIETPFGISERTIGGSGTYISLSSSYFASHSKQVNVVAVIGNDFPEKGMTTFKEHGVNTDGIQVKENEKSFFWHGKYHHDMNSRDTLVTELNVLGDFDPVIPESYQDCEYLMLGNLAPKVQQNVIERLKKRPKLIVMDTMNFWMEPAFIDDLKHTMTMVDVLSINDEEARQLSGEYSLVKAARKIMTMGPKYLIIKKGEHGALLFHEKNIFFTPALPLEEVFDPTGAGDTFAGGFIGYLADTDDVSFDNMKRAIVYGSAMASFCVGKFGTDGLIDLPSDALTERVREFVDLVQFEIAMV